uniref:RING-type E3 ubiquitin transferase n=1 Tax=Oryctolagus cuniculus TaxID=9986 RepID=A0A5F9CYU3_RABIT
MSETGTSPGVSQSPSRVEIPALVRACGGWRFRASSWGGGQGAGVVPSALGPWGLVGCHCDPGPGAGWGWGPEIHAPRPRRGPRGTGRVWGSDGDNSEVGGEWLAVTHVRWGGLWVGCFGVLGRACQPFSACGKAGFHLDAVQKSLPWYFLHGVCKEGDNCRYSHDLSDSPYGVVCKYFQRGYCIYGDRCRYEHSKPLEPEDTTAAELTAKASLAASSSLPSAAAPRAAMNAGEAESSGHLAALGAGSEDWANAIEFVPGQPYCGRTSSSCTEAPPQGSGTPAEPEKEQTTAETKKQLCPYAAVGECRYGENCVYLHGDSCDMCGLQVLHPVDTAQRSQHIKSCIEAHEKDMELSFAVQRSKDMVCGICMEVVYEKANPSERRFGILSNCSHTYCLKCIRKWRSAKQFESKIINWLLA